MSPARDTIFALSSGRPPAAIAVVRVSGPQARAALEALSGRVPPPRQASLARLRDPQSGEILDEALALWFPGPRSETGEDMAELQLHGGRAVLAAVLAALARLPGFRPAEPGEFTRRAFENGRLDLTAVEGLADLIGAETEAQRRQAYRQMKGLLGDRAESWRGLLVQALALVEAGIDFSDEADVPEELVRPALEIARQLHDEISAVLAQAGRGERLRDGFVVAIAGPPNAGKSTLLNRIAKREAAIVSPHAGTTRDVIEVHLDLGGYPVTLLDTAGLRETDDPVEQEGVRRARERAAAADLVLWVVEAGGPMTEFMGQWPTETGSMGYTSGPLNDESGLSDEAGPFRRISPLVDSRAGGNRPSAAPAATARPMADRPPVWVIHNKIDLLPGGGQNHASGQVDTESSRAGSDAVSSLASEHAPASSGAAPSAGGPAPRLLSSPSGPSGAASLLTSGSAPSVRDVAAPLPSTSPHAASPRPEFTLADAETPSPLPPIPRHEFMPADAERISPPGPPAARPEFMLANAEKIPSPLPPTPRLSASEHAPPGSSAADSYRNEYKIENEHKFISISAIGGAGIEDLLRRLESHVLTYFGSESSLITRERHRFDLRSVQAALTRALAEEPGREEIVAEELRLASRALARLTGKVDVEDVLDAIFRDFCIGK